jgi:hypothetical protein
MAAGGAGPVVRSPREVTPFPARRLCFRPARIDSTAQLAAVSYLARYNEHTHALDAYQLREWFSWCEVHGLDPLRAAGIPQRW